MSVLKNISITIITLFILLITAEILLRYFISPLNSGWGWNESPRKYLSHWEKDKPNQIGSRGQIIKYSDNDFVVLLVGDSQVESATSSPSEMPEQLLQTYLERKLNQPVKVFSIAASAWGQDQQLFALKKYYKNYRADLVLLWATPKNDFWENTFPDRNISRVAGHLKPTFLLEEGSIAGPFYSKNEYYKNSVLLQLFCSAWLSLNEETIEQLILDNWESKIPPPHKVADLSAKIEKVNSDSEVSFNTFIQNISHYSNRDSLTIILREDFINSRSHFSPFSIDKSERDKYLIRITKKLYEKIFELTKLNSSKFFVFYPNRKDYDYIYTSLIKKIKLYSSNHYFDVNMDYLELIKSVVSENKLLSFSVEGGDELSVSFKDRHLSVLGNKLVMEELAECVKDLMILQ